MARRTKAKPAGSIAGKVMWLGILLIAIVIWNGWKRDHNDPAPYDPDPAYAPADDFDSPETGEAYALAGSRDSWPPMGDAAPAVVPSGELLRDNYYVVLDGSGSMQRVDCSGDDSKIEVAQQALTRFVATVPPEAGLGLAVFDDNGLSERVPLGTGNRQAFAEALSEVRASGGTPLRSSIDLAYRRLVDQGRVQLGYGDYHLVVVTDGYPDPRSEDPTPVVESLLDHSPVLLHTIGFCIGEDHVLNQPGRVYYFAANSPEQLDQGLGGVLAEAPSFDPTEFAQ